MAFNPFVSFRKYQKFWMASILLLCMLTFVVCTGVGGDLGDRLLQIFRSRHGKAFARLEGRSLYQEDFDKLKIQRRMINDFMHECIKVDLAQIEHLINENPLKFDDQHMKALEVRLGAVKNDLMERKLRKNYFDTGTTLEELIDFMVWKKLADKLGVELDDKTISNYPSQERPFPGLFQQEVFARVPLPDTMVEVFPSKGAARTIQYDLRHKYPNINDQAVIAALRDEYRVRIAQQAYLQSQPGSYQIRNSRELKYLKFKSINQFYYEETRFPLSPAQMWDIYQDKRSHVDIALIPVRVDHFLDQVKPLPTENELKAYFEKFKKVSYDPASPTPGFEIPAKVRVEYVMADPEMPFYKGAAQLVSFLEMTPPLAYSPFFPHIAAAATYGSSPLAWNASMERNYEFAKTGRFGRKYLAAPLTEPAFPSLLDYLSQPPAFGYKDKADGRPWPELVTSLAGLAGLGAGLEPASAIQLSYYGHLYPKYKKELDALLPEENKPRARLLATLVGLGANSPLNIHPSFGIFKAWERASFTERYLPAAAVAGEMKDRREHLLAQTWVNDNMNALKEWLDDKAGKNKVFLKDLGGKIRQFGLKHEFTSDFYNRFNIAKAPELADLEKSFQKERDKVNFPEGKVGEERLKEGDFYKLFFSQESFAAADKYVAKPWPSIVEVKSNLPNVPPKTVNFFEQAERPFLFWKTDGIDSQEAKDLNQDNMRQRVLTAWKMEKAKEAIALAEAKKIADRLEKAGGDLSKEVRAEAHKLGAQPIDLPRVAPLYAEQRDRGRTYTEYPLPKNTFEFPRPDLVKQLLTLASMSKSVENEYKAADDPKKKFKALDEANKKLYEAYKKVPEVGKKIQILTNLPQNTFYVAVVVSAPPADLSDFVLAYKGAAGLPRIAGMLDTLVDTFQDGTAKEFRQAFMLALRNSMNYQADFTEEERKNFDAGSN